MVKDALWAEHELEGKAAVVTGAGGGVGRRAAEGLAAAGCAVAAIDLDTPLARRTAERIRARGGRAISISAGATCLEEARRGITGSIEALSRVDIVVNSLASFPCGYLGALPEVLQSSALELNLRATLFFSEAFAEHRIDTGTGGAVINLAPRGLFVEEPHRAVAKRLIALTRDLAHRLSPHGVRVNAIAADHDDERPHRLPRVEGERDDLLGLVLLLASPEASSVTGGLIVADESALRDPLP